MRVAFVGRITPDHIDGVTSAVLKLYLGLLDTVEHAAVFSTALNAVYNAGTLVQPYKNFDASDFDTVIIAGCYELGFWSAAAKCKMAGIPYIVSPHGSLMRASWLRSWEKKLAVWPVLAGFYFRGKMSIHFLSEEERANSWTFWQTNVFCVPNIFSKGDQNDLPEAPRRKVIGFLGRLDVHHKGLDVLVEGIALISRQLRSLDYKVELVGPDHKNGRVLLEKAVAQRGLSKLVSIASPKAGAEKRQWLQSTKVFVHASRYEGQPQSVFEAIAAGAVPVVSTGCNMNQVIKELGYGAVCVPSAQGIAEALLKGISQAEQTSSRASANWVQEKYAPSKIAANFLEEIQKFRLVKK